MLADTDNLFVISAPIVTIISALLIPILNGLLTRITVSGGIKGLITLVMNTIMAFITTTVSDTGAAIFSYQTLYTAVVGFLISVAIYAGVYRPAEITSSSPAGKLGPNTGPIA